MLELTLAHDITRRRLGTPIRTIPIRLNTSTQNNPYNSSKNSFKYSHICGSPLSGVEQRWFDQYKELYCKASEMFSSIRDGRSLMSVLASRESSSLQILKRSCLIIVLRQAAPSCTLVSRRMT